VAALQIPGNEEFAYAISASSDFFPMTDATGYCGLMFAWDLGHHGAIHASVQKIASQTVGSSGVVHVTWCLVCAGIDAASPGPSSTSVSSADSEFKSPLCAVSHAT